MINRYDCTAPLPATPFSFSILISSPIRRNLRFCPVSAMILPLASTKIHFASMIVVGLDVLMSFLFKRSLAHPPNLTPTPSELNPVTLSLPQLNQLILATINGQVPIPAPVQSAPGQGFGPVGPDEPLFPDNLSFSLFVSSSFAPFDGSPDTSFTVPLFEIPGAPGNLIIALGSLIAQYLIERTGIGPPNGNKNGTEG